MTDDDVDRPEPGQPGINPGRDAFVAGRDLTVYLTYSGTWAAGSDVPSLLAESGGIEAPYRGLSPFGEQDEALFFGRERAVTSVLELLSERLDGSGLLVVSGVSGAGKSSLLRAGVLPALRRDGLAPARPRSAPAHCRSCRTRWTRPGGSVPARTSAWPTMSGSAASSTPSPYPASSPLKVSAKTRPTPRSRGNWPPPRGGCPPPARQRTPC